jgi:hypothetical protein
MKKLLTELHQSKIVKDGRNIYLEGVVAKSEERNNNNRIYPKHVLENAMDGLQDKIRNGTAFSELGHSQSLEPSLDRVAGLIESVRRHGNTYHGRIRLIPEGMGKIAMAIVQSNGTLGASTKGVGSVKPRKDGINEVQSDYKCVGIDIVGAPSCQSAFLSAIDESIRSNKLTLTESAVAMNILRESFSAADFARSTEDEFSRSIVAGHAGFPSTSGDDSTYVERSVKWTANIVSQLADLNLQMQNAGLTDATLDKYIELLQALRTAQPTSPRKHNEALDSDPFVRQAQLREAASDRKMRRIRESAMRMLSRGGKYNQGNINESTFIKALKIKESDNG